MPIQLLCRKLGMTQIFDETGECIPVTVLEAGPNRVVQKKTAERDGYTALQLGFGERPLRRTPKPLLGHFQRTQSAPTRLLRESRVSPEEAEAYPEGGEVKVDVFAKGQRVDVTGTSKGRGTAGVVKRHGFPKSRVTHGTHEYFRHGGSIGAGSFPGHVFKGLRMAGRMGNCRVTIVDLEVVRVDPENNLLFVRGSVPGHSNAFVEVRPSVKA